LKLTPDPPFGALRAASQDGRRSAREWLLWSAAWKTMLLTAALVKRAQADCARAACTVVIGSEFVARIIRG
jgi:hypothetical protein